MKKTIIKTLIIVVICLTIGFFAGMEYKAYQIRSVFKKATDQISGVLNQPQQTGTAMPEESKWTDKNVGDVVELATLKFQVIKSEEKQTISSSNMFSTPKVAKSGAKFVVIDLELTNTTNAPFTFFNMGGGFVLVDDKERQFTEYEDTIGSIDNYLDSRKLSPSIAERGVLVYEIPQDAINYGLAVGKGGTNEVYKVILK